MSKETGTVKWFNDDKGFGFTTRTEGQDALVHFRSINSQGRKTVREGDRVAFTLSQGQKGPQAENVDII